MSGVRASRLGLGELLDRAAALVAAELPERAALGALAALPLRLLQVWFVARLGELGAEATGHGRYLLAISAWITLALPLAFWGRAQLAFACQTALAGDEASAGGRDPARLGMPWRAYLAGLYAALVAAALYPAAGWGIVSLPLIGLASGLAAATCPFQERPGIWAPLATAARGFAAPRLLIGLLFAVAFATLVALINLVFLVRVGLWAAQAASGLSLAWWDRALSVESGLFVLLLLAGAWTVVEPVWIAGLSIVVHRSRAQASGDDLAGWIAELGREEAA